ncbi:MAG: 3-oxoacyl-[acyl-carrier protein] reductase [uncultured Thermomicrobiales bacterium]|uniref:3-oxoacyl-[acyl-carrier protein] reductase n=1 Tax=uncultured Thermomicrobiales bacterium TaxID=1645740 RepID=A0A6J4VJS2_9BACT|nr:MAG: 3-oxoacyl-[acyl-carrier protein] reductase [uncultured Thermomicrobiales bacterium]
MPHIRELFDLTGKVALVTGGSRGLGREIAEGLAEAGATVAITARREQWLGPTQEELRAAGLAVTAHACDVTDPAAVVALVERIVADHGALDIVVNNAGISWGGAAEEMAVENFRKVVDTNVTGTFLVSQAAARRMIPRGRGVIINTASIAGINGSAPEVLRAVGYSASKGAVIALTRQLATEWAAHGIRVNAIAPGFFPSRMTEAVIAQGGERMTADVPLGRLGRAGELKGVVLFLASDAASYITGQTLIVDGGATAW